MIDFVLVSSDLRPYVLDTWVKRGAELSTDHHLVDELDPLAEEEVGQTWQTQTYCEGLLGTSGRALLSGSSKLCTQGLWSGSKGCCQAEEGVLSDHVGLWDSWTQLMAGQASLQPGLSWRQNPGLGGVCLVRPWRSTIGRPRRNSGKPSGASEQGSSTLPSTVHSAGGELLTSTGNTVGRWKEYFEELLNPTDTPSTEEAEAEDSEVVRKLGWMRSALRYLKSLDVVGLSWLIRLCKHCMEVGDSTCGVANLGW
ncbi:hypothetical protein L3Q82_013054 [Scortum barcoo]|uniref:Uncharacterized protein n=1 Tax=Scortum barcoo TaxID=214431 RepID=A0ACB8VZ37_9TELE|nr:hypothetical protein L3Q82_013054 [Scortum barcoo]